MAGITKSDSTSKKVKNTLRPRKGLLARVVSNRFIRGFGAIAAVVAAIPILFTLIYTLPQTTPVSTLIIGRAATLQSVDRKWVALDDIAPVLAHSVLMSEDGKFCSHHGVDWVELNGVIDDALEGEKTRGASTLPMQAVKNLFLWPQRSYIRKIIEVPYALVADLVWSKPRMMEIYLNIVEWDEGVFGAEAASRHYFNKPASQLTRREAALLAVTLPNPKGRNPAKPSKSLSRLAKVVEERAKQSGAYIRCLASE